MNNMCEKLVSYRTLLRFIKAGPGRLTYIKTIIRPNGPKDADSSNQFECVMGKQT